MPAVSLPSELRGMRTHPTAIGLDLGTSAVKAVLLAADGRLLGEASSPLTLQRPVPAGLNSTLPTG